MDRTEAQAQFPGNIRGIAVVTALYLALAVTCVFLVPLWEAPDEPAHFLRIRAEARRLGLLSTGEPNRWLLPPGGERPPADHPGLALQRRAGFWKKGTVVSGYERHQPPGYYLLAAPLLALSGGDAQPPFFFNHQYQDRQGQVFHHGADRDPPFRGARRAVLRLRLLSVCFGAATVILTWLIAGGLLPAGPGRRTAALAAAAFTAFLPQFVFVTSVINNDALALALAALFFKVLIRPPDTRPLLTPGRAVLLALIFAAALLTKFTLLFLLPAALVYLAAAGPGRTAFRTAAAGAAALLVPLLLVLAAPDRFTAIGAHWNPLRQVGRMSTVGHNLLQWESLLDAARLFFTSSWGVFGWMSIFPPPLLTAAYIAVSMVMGLGLLRLLGQRTEQNRTTPGPVPAPGVRALFIVALAGIALPVLRNALFTFQPQGRLFFPLLPLAAPLAAAGLQKIGRRGPLRPWLPVALFMLGATLYGLWGMIRPFYQPERAPITFTLPAESAILYGLYGAGFEVNQHAGQSTVARLVFTGALRLFNPEPRGIEAALRFTADMDTQPGRLEVWDRRGRVAGFDLGKGHRFFQLERVSLPPGETVLFFHLPENGGQDGCQVSGLTLAVPGPRDRR